MLSLVYYWDLPLLRRRSVVLVPSHMAVVKILFAVIRVANFTAVHAITAVAAVGARRSGWSYAIPRAHRRVTEMAFLFPFAGSGVAKPFSKGVVIYLELGYLKNWQSLLVVLHNVCALYFAPHLITISYGALNSP